MITGDHVVTASAIARELGILRSRRPGHHRRRAGRDDRRELDQEVSGISVYARVSPENKIRIVKAWQRKGQVVSMTGDGVNDAPALKAADIGCAMGITGTDVAKGAADMTLTDDNFATIVDAVKEGRGIYANIRKVVGFLLGTNIGEVSRCSSPCCSGMKRRCCPCSCCGSTWSPTRCPPSRSAWSRGRGRHGPPPRPRTRACLPTGSACASSCRA
ncbi:MAG: HAD-IC family P-type ATPase [Acutalibacteraceae bacterium]